MLGLAVVNRAETFERMVDPLGERGIDARHVTLTEQTTPLGSDRPYDPDQFDVGFVFPGRLTEGGVLDAMLDVPWLNNREAILRSRNKAAVLTRLDAADIPVPETVLVSNPVDDAAVDSAFERFDPPVVLKPTTTTRGIGVAKVHDSDSLSGVTDYLDLVHDFRATGDKSYLLQEYLPAARDIRAMVLDGEYVGAVERRLPAAEREAGGWKHNVHRGATATPIDLDADQQELVERVAQELEIDLLGVDLLVTDDRTVVSETNARPTIDDADKYEDGFYDQLAGLIKRTASNG